MLPLFTQKIYEKTITKLCQNEESDEVISYALNYSLFLRI